jgi:hypothetical protein
LINANAPILSSGSFVGGASPVGALINANIPVLSSSTAG